MANETLSTNIFTKPNQREKDVVIMIATNLAVLAA